MSPRSRSGPGSGFGDDLAQKHIQALSSDRADAPLADELDDGLELQEIPAGSGPDFSVDGGEAEAEPVVVGGDSTGADPASPSPLPAVMAQATSLPPPEIPLVNLTDANALAGQVIAALKAQGAPVTDGVIQASIEGMMRNAQAGVIQGATVEGAITTAVRMNMRHQAAESSALSMEAATRASIMAEPRIPWRHEKRFKVTINGWVMVVPAGRLVQVPLSVHEVLQKAIEAEVIVKSMQLEMYNRMTGIPAPVEDTNLYEGYDDHHMRALN